MIRPPVPSEHDEQRAFIQWWDLAHPDILCHSIPNGGRRSMGVARKMKAEGLRPGIPDLMVPEYRLYIEFKRQKGGSLSQVQKTMIAHLESIGYTVLVVRGVQDAIDQVTVFLRNHKQD